MIKLMLFKPSGSKIFNLLKIAMLCLTMVCVPVQAQQDDFELKIVDLGDDDISYLTLLALMRGHLYVGYELYKAGQLEHAKTHMKHPKSELYSQVESAFAARGTKGFASELKAISLAVESDKGQETVLASYSQVKRAIDINERAVSKESLRPVARFQIVSAILEDAAEEYGFAVVDGQMRNAHEYQDSLGFTKIAKEIISSTKAANKAEQVELTRVSRLIKSLDSHWPSLIPPETLTTEADDIFSVSEQIKAASRRLSGSGV